ncbi:MAG TPA: molybdenum cofactor guanylyltransferase [Devosiaceae bacterium]|nr:molybdenum cofactor guanylyltransferase [Devosiaceae bacterium]
MTAAVRIAAVILAGGGASRLGGVDKARVLVGGVPLLARVAERVGRQAETVAVAVPQGGAIHVRPGMAVIRDTLAPPGGPLGGLAAAGVWAGKAVGPDALVLSAPVDTPFFPEDFASRAAALFDPEIDAVAGSHSGQVYPLCALWRVSALCRLPAHLAANPDDRRVFGFLDTLNWRPLACEAPPGNPFANANNVGDLVALSGRVR